MVHELVVPSSPTPSTMSTLPSMRLPTQGRVNNMIVLPASVLQWTKSHISLINTDSHKY